MCLNPPWNTLSRTCQHVKLRSGLVLRPNPSPLWADSASVSGVYCGSWFLVWVASVCVCVSVYPDPPHHTHTRIHTTHTKKARETHSGLWDQSPERRNKYLPCVNICKKMPRPSEKEDYGRNGIGANNGQVDLKFWVSSYRLSDWGASREGMAVECVRIHTLSYALTHSENAKSWLEACTHLQMAT